VTPDDRASGEHTLDIGKGKIIGFCSKVCLNKFNRTPAQYINAIPELKPPAPAKKPEDPKTTAKPGASASDDHGPCEVKKTAKGWFCLKCDRELTVDDVRNSLCKRCETKPAEIEYCVKSSGIIFRAECHPNKTDTKPIS
jgi:hypothetical protein